MVNRLDFQILSGRRGLLIILLPTVCLLIWIHASTRTEADSWRPLWLSGAENITERRNRTAQLASTFERGHGLAPLNYRDLEKRVIALQGRCRKDEKRWQAKYGKRNVAMSRTYEGSRARIRDLVRRVLLGEELVLGALGGSVTAGHQIDHRDGWDNRLIEWLNEFLPPAEDYRAYQREYQAEIANNTQKWRMAQSSGDKWQGYNAGVPATGSDYFSFCHSLHAPTADLNLIIVELAVNDEFLPEHTENMENLLRGLLELPRNPAVIMVQALSLSAGSIATGGDVHTPVAVYYDVPVITQRNALGAHFMRNPDLVHPYFTVNYWQDVDLRHISARGHHDLANLIASLVQDTACDLVELEDDEAQAHGEGHTEVDLILERILTEHFKTQPSVPLHPSEEFFRKPLEREEQQRLIKEDAAFWQDKPKDVKPWGPWLQPKHSENEQPREWEGEWPGEWTMGQVPRLRFLQRWDEHTTNLPLEPQCFSMASERYPLEPISSSGWEPWFRDDNPEKLYLKADKPGARVTVEIETRKGTIKIYHLKSKWYGLGSVSCWADDDTSRAVRADGWWDHGDLNIGRFTTVREDLPPGLHTVTCELLSETLDPDGGTEFRLISVMR